tara:strand:+ start:468 stop:839 length:372 start_codon:yes stop_codon:yes gene_type:complete
LQLFISVREEEKHAMSIKNETEFAPISINLSPETIDESYLSALGAQLELLLKHMFQNTFAPVSITGTQPQISSFARAMGNERRYLQSFEKYGLNDPRTLGNRHKLEMAIAGFERETGIKWPFK